MIDLFRPPRDPPPFHKSVPEVRALRPALDDAIGGRLDRLARAGLLQLHRGRVNKEAVFRAFGISVTSAHFLGVAAEHFERHDRLLAEAGVLTRKWEGLPERMIAFLQEQLEAGTLVRKLQGHGACRIWISDTLGFHKQMLVTDKPLLDAVEAFDAALAPAPLQETGKYRHLHLQMKAFLEEGWRKGALKLGHDGVNRAWLAGQFGVHNPIYVRYPETKRVVDEFDASIRDELSAGPAYPTLAADLRKLIAKGELPVFKDRLNETELARRLNVGPSAFQLVPECLEILAEAKDAVRSGDPLRPFHEGHGRNYSFHPLAEAYGASGAADLARRFCYVAGPAAASAKQQYRSILELLARVAELLPPRQVAAIGKGALVRGRVVEAALRQWRTEYLAETGEPHVLSGDVVSARALLERMKLFGDATEVLVRLGGAHRQPHGDQVQPLVLLHLPGHPARGQGRQLPDRRRRVGDGRRHGQRHPRDLHRLPPPHDGRDLRAVREGRADAGRTRGRDARCRG